ncbi:alpha/beta hydrolase [Leptolyngbya ohadii]|uniref:alpha/beta hydrolase n=1 Tax=Leptolyngbya ohadii TaxID=1962290 RepID=UPI0015C5E7F2|nr:alpha/beta hydrolase [Leptolyngbya ohadii]
MSKPRVVPLVPQSPFAPRVDRPWQRLRGFLWGIGLGLGWGMTAPAMAANQLAIRVGPFQQSIQISDLEYFAQTGHVPTDLRLYAPLLTDQVRYALRSRLHLDPNVGDKLVEDLLHSSSGERFLNTLQVAIPSASPAQLRATLMQAARRPDGMSLLGLLRSFPEDTVTLDAASAVALASQVNLPYWQSQTLSSVLERELTVDSPPLRSRIDPSEMGQQWVWKQSLTLRDYQRDRSIPIDLYWSRRTQGPLVVLSHGFGADRRFLSYMAYHLASNGISVVAIEHPGSNVAWLTSNSLDKAGVNAMSTILPASEFVDRPKDVSFVLDRLQQMNRFSSRLRGKLNTEQVTIMGHSLGGYTALALAGAQPNLKHLRQFCNDPTPIAFSPADLLQCNAADLPETVDKLRDSRIAQVVLLNPVIGRLFDQKSLEQVDVPTLMLASTDDAITPAVSQQFLPFTELKTSQKYLLTAIGATHLSVGDPANLNHSLTQSIFVRERPDEETKALRELLQGVSLAFIKQLTPEADRYKPFLSPAYAQSFSTQNIQLRLNADLPPNFTNWLKVAALPMEQIVSGTLAQRRQAAQQNLCDLNPDCLMNNLPLVMFILPGGLPLAATQLLRRRKRNQKLEAIEDTTEASQDS